VTTTAEPRIRIDLPARELTLDDITALAEADEFHRYELSEGVLSLMSPPDDRHNAIVTRLLVWFVAHGVPPEDVLAASGVRIAGHTGRTPDLLVRRRRPRRATVWLDPSDVVLVMEVVSRSTASVDRLVKPPEYAGAGIAHYWRVERDGATGVATVHQSALGTDPDGLPAYIARRAVLLDDLLAEDPPELLP
jgi:Uma2 family endonuclease